MKTVEERAESVMNRYRSASGLLYSILVEAFKEQDRDTRHACAEAVLELHTEDFEGVAVIGKDSAHAACMNVKAV